MFFSVKHLLTAINADTLRKVLVKKLRDFIKKNELILQLLLKIFPVTI